MTQAEVDQIVDAMVVDEPQSDGRHEHGALPRTTYTAQDDSVPVAQRDRSGKWGIRQGQAQREQREQGAFPRTRLALRNGMSQAEVDRMVDAMVSGHLTLESVAQMNRTGVWGNQDNQNHGGRQEYGALLNPSSATQNRGQIVEMDRNGNWTVRGRGEENRHGVHQAGPNEVLEMDRNGNWGFRDAQGGDSEDSGELRDGRDRHRGDNEDRLGD